MSEQKTFTLAQPAYLLPADEVAESLNTSFERGLSKQEAKRRHETVGNNAIEGGGGVSIWKVFMRQVANALTLVLPAEFPTNSRYWSWQWRCHMVQPILLKEESSLPSLLVNPDP